jgi:hypothetical protein
MNRDKQWEVKVMFACCNVTGAFTWTYPLSDMECQSLSVGTDLLYLAHLTKLIFICER